MLLLRFLLILGCLGALQAGEDLLAFNGHVWRHIPAKVPAATQAPLIICLYNEDAIDDAEAAWQRFAKAGWGVLLLTDHPKGGMKSKELVPSLEKCLAVVDKRQAIDHERVVALGFWYGAMAMYIAMDNEELFAGAIMVGHAYSPDEFAQHRGQVLGNPVQIYHHPQSLLFMCGSKDATLGTMKGLVKPWQSIGHKVNQYTFPGDSAQCRQKEIEAMIAWLRRLPATRPPAPEAKEHD